MACGTRGQGRVIPLTIVTGLLLVVACFGYLRAEPPATNDRVYLRNASGAVLFDHAVHAGQVDGCIDCHHDLAGEFAAECTDCHDDDSYAPDLLSHAELLEIDDHECSGCHDIAGDDQAQSCRECHAAAEIAGVYHTQCNACHLEVSSARFATDGGAARCSACHLK